MEKMSPTFFSGDISTVFFSHHTYICTLTFHHMFFFVIFLYIYTLLNTEMTSHFYALRSNLEIARKDNRNSS